MPLSAAAEQRDPTASLLCAGIGRFTKADLDMEQIYDYSYVVLEEK